MVSDFTTRIVPAFCITLIIAVAINYFGSLFLYDELRMAWGFDLLVACTAALISYCRSLRKYLAQLEQRITKLEQQLSSRP